MSATISSMGPINKVYVALGEDVSTAKSKK